MAETVTQNDRSASVDRGPGYVPAFDGMRAVGLAFMLAYHAGAWFTKGAIFALSMFFTLSGFLITSLLLNEIRRTGRIDLRRFWVRRFRRLLPAALLVLGLVVVFGVTVADDTQRAMLRGDVLAALGYVANWRFIASGQAYLDQFRTPSPVQHFWSLAIEEQFYVLFPLLAAGVIALGGAARRGFSVALRNLTVLLVVGVAASTALNVWGGLGPDRTYYGTDTRAAELLVGALLAVVLCGRPMGTATKSTFWRRVLAVAGPLAMLVSVATWIWVPKNASWIYHGGFPAYAVVSAIWVAGSNDPNNLVARLLRGRGFAWVGRRSYGIYLIHFPLFLWLTPARTGLSFWPLFAILVTISVVLAEAMFRLLEEPMRRGRPLLGQPLGRLAPFVASLVVVAVLATTAAVQGGTVLEVTSRPNALRVHAGADADTSPVVPEGESAIGAPITTSPTATIDPTSSVAPTAAPPTTASPTTASSNAVPTSVSPAVETRTGPQTAAPWRSIVDSLAHPHPIAGGLTAKPLRRPHRKLRLMIVGDSSAVFLAYALANFNDTAQVYDISAYGLMGCGLIRGGTEIAAGVERGFADTCSQWPDIWKAGLQDAKPDLVVMAGSFHDVTDRRLTADGPLEHIGQQHFDDVWTATAKAAADLLHSSGAPVFWLNNPPVKEGLNQPDSKILTDPGNDPARMDVMNGLLGQAVAGRPFVHVVDYAGFFLTWPGGAFDPTLRQDGLHVDYDGRTIVGHWLGAELLDQYWRVVKK